MKRFLVLAVLLTGVAQATDLRIYNSFTEVRDPVKSNGNTLSVSLTQETWASIFGGFLRPGKSPL